MCPHTHELAQRETLNTSTQQRVLTYSRVAGLAHRKALLCASSQRHVFTHTRVVGLAYNKTICDSR